MLMICVLNIPDLRAIKYKADNYTASKVINKTCFALANGMWLGNCWSKATIMIPTPVFRVTLCHARKYSYFIPQNNKIQF